MNPTSTDSALRLIAWSRIWSPIVPDDLREEAWAALGLPETFATISSTFWSTFQVGAGAPAVPLLLHAALGREAAAAREDWMRASHHLGLSWGEVHLAPDQLGAACEVYACAIDRRERVLIEELRSRYLLPWCEFARAKLADQAGEERALLILPERYEADLVAVPLTPPETPSPRRPRYNPGHPESSHRDT